jgi:hypothetical protein
MSEIPVNCGRCAHLWNREPNHPDKGQCACHARQQQTGKIRELVTLTETCERAQLSAKFDPDFMPRLRAARRGDWEKPEPPAEPVSKPAQPTPPAHESRKNKLF